MGLPLFGQDHVDRYRETDGEEGHDWQGTTVLLLTTTGRNSGAKRTTPLIYQRPMAIPIGRRTRPRARASARAARPRSCR
jgi:F420H(2)-dependent quinone reductase